MSKVRTFLIAGYLDGVIAQFIYLHFFHPIMKFTTKAYALGVSLVWAVGKYSPPWWVWLVAFGVGIFAAFGDEIAQTTDEIRKILITINKIINSLPTKFRQPETLFRLPEVYIQMNQK